MSERGHAGEEREPAYDYACARRQALGRILGPRAQTIQNDTIGHALRATNFLGLGRAAARRYAAISARATPLCLEALEAGDPDRIRALNEASVYLRQLAAAGFGHFAVKPLVSLGFRLALKEVKAHAAEEGFDPHELEDELRVFQRAFEARIVYRA